MSGFNTLKDFVLGYDDGHKSTDDSRNLYAAQWYAMNARPGLIINLQFSKIVLRQPCNEAEYVVTKIVAKTLDNMRIER